ncbi:MotA/TolQ/ExbB proton channel family protein [Oceanibaculum pacificum]|nr:MotA/TolQ/ExbB proton channel family protein [Oceanibaculum pacificum]
MMNETTPPTAAPTAPSTGPSTAPSTGPLPADAAVAPLPGADVGADMVEPPLSAMDQALGLIHAGGPVVIILLVLSVIALTIVLLKLFQFASMRVGSRGFIAKSVALYRAGRPAEALSVLKGVRNPIAEVMAVAIDGLRHRVDPDAVREEAGRIGMARIEGLRSYLRGLEVIASLSPLLGLFGTVIGMIEAFQQMEGAGANINPAILSGGIWVALLTTAVGLAVAIPAVAALNWIERTIDSLAHDMEDAATQIFTATQFASMKEREPASFRAAHAQPAE